MTSASPLTPAVSLRPGEHVSGFSVLKVTPLSSLGCCVVEAVHDVTRAKCLHVVADDDENLFAIAFRTPPPDNTGVPHILEHSVLNGSRRFPVKDPFVEMLKMSMATFLNAMTYPDKTVYPVASNVRQDFFNLVDVYCDAVLNPRITPLTLKQEGCRFAFEDPARMDSPLVLKGVVYNEMKGAYSDVDSLVDRIAEQVLFPDTPYGFDSGGDPDAIPGLTYNRFRDFYRRLYHPANARIVLYGNIATQEHFAFLDERLRECPPPPADLDSGIPLQTRWAAPGEHRERYPVDPDENTTGKAAVTLNWLVGTVDEPAADLAMEVVDRLLLGSDAAPLHKALIDSQLGKDLTHSGYANSILETTFHVGMKGTDAARKDDIVNLVFEVLGKVADEGFDDERVRIAFNQMQYSHREIQAHYPLRLMQWIYNTWLYDRDPLVYLRTGEYLDEVETSYKQDPELFQKLVRERLLDNPHRMTAVFEPDPELEKERAETERAWLAAKKAEMSDRDLQQLQEETRELDRLQSTPNPPEAVAKLSQLKLSDVPSVPRTIPGSVDEPVHGIPLVRSDVEANGVNYLLLAFDMTGLEHDLRALVPLFCRLLTRTGTDEWSYVDVAEKIAGHTGGLHAGTFVGSDALEPPLTLPYVTVSMKSLDATYSNALNLVETLLRKQDLSDRARVRDVIKQTRERLVSSIIPNGHRIAMQHASRTLSDAANLAHNWSGVPQFRLLESMTAAADSELDAVCAKLEQIRMCLLNRKRLKVSFTGSPSCETETRRWLQSLVPSFSDASFPERASVAREETADGLREGLAMMANVAYCATCFSAPHVSAPESPALRVFSRLLSFDYLWDEIRAKGGAYGGFCNYDPDACVFQMGSYRDPNIERTLAVYDGLQTYVADHEWTPDEIQRAVIGCAKAAETPVRPGWATGTALWRHLARLSDDMRRQRREALLGLTPAVVREAGRRLLARNYSRANTAVLASRTHLESANANLEQPLTVEGILG